MSGGEFTLNQIIPKDAFQLTKGKLSVYTYKGDSGRYISIHSPTTQVLTWGSH